MKRLLIAMLVTAVAPTTMLAQPARPGSASPINTAAPQVTQGPARESRIFELRTYHVAAGKLDVLHERFQNHTIRLLAQHGIECIGFWLPSTNDGNNLVVLHAYPSMAARAASWERFAIDPEWRKIKAQTEADGKLVDQIDAVILTPTDFCPVVSNLNNGKQRCFELRIIRGGNPAVMASRCKDHALQLFKQNGLTHIGSWTPSGGKMAEGVSLISLVACDSAESHQKSVRSFQDDPFWSSVPTETDPGWRALRNGGDVMVLLPTNYSPLR